MFVRSWIWQKAFTYRGEEKLKTLIVILGEGQAASANKKLKSDFDVEVGVPSDNRPPPVRNGVISFLRS